MENTYFIRQSVESLLKQVDSRLIKVLDDFVQENHIKGWTRYHDEFDKYPVGEYNSHLNQVLIAEKDHPLEHGAIVKAGNDGFEYKVGNFLRTLIMTPDGKVHDGKFDVANLATFYIYESLGCMGKNIPPEAWEIGGIVRLNSEGFMNGDGLCSFKNPYDGTIFKPGDKCPICGLWGVETTLVQIPGKNPACGYCPRQVKTLYGNSNIYNSVLEQYLGE
jgi:hypothetical protein